MNLNDMNALPRIGQPVNVRGIEGTIVALRPMGTLDVQLPDGRRLRVSGLPFALCGYCGGAKPIGQSCICFDNDSQ